jgi:hypothetical protein
MHPDMIWLHVQALIQHVRNQPSILPHLMPCKAMQHCGKGYLIYGLCVTGIWTSILYVTIIWHALYQRCIPGGDSTRYITSSTCYTITDEIAMVMFCARYINVYF